MYEYSRSVYYYETDKMGVVHHSNYPRWLEEARISFFSGIGLPYEDTEAKGILSPVTEMELKFRCFARFGDRFTVRIRMIKYTGVRFTILFTIVNQDGTLLLEGHSVHAFINMDYRPVHMSKVMPEKHAVMLENVEREPE